LPDGARTIPMIIHYSYDISEKSFKVTPAHYKKYFSPQPGTHETVSLPIKNKGKHVRLILTAHSKDQSKKVKHANSGRKTTDVDMFVMRRNK